MTANHGGRPRRNRRRKGHPPVRNVVPFTRIIARDDAVHTIAGHLADRDAFVVLVPPGMVPTVADRLTTVPSWTGYLDAGLPTLLHTNSGKALIILPLLVPHTAANANAVITIPKTIPAATLAKALGQHIADDGSKDIVLIHETGPGPLAWPMVFIDALAQVDPAAAAQLHANDLTRQS
jgi:hypothetical protein